MEAKVSYTAGTAVPTMKDSFVEVRTRRGKLIFRYDPERDLVEWSDSKGTELIDLRQYK